MGGYIGSEDVFCIVGAKISVSISSWVLLPSSLEALDLDLGLFLDVRTLLMFSILNPLSIPIHLVYDITSFSICDKRRKFQHRKGDNILDDLVVV